MSELVKVPQEGARLRRPGYGIVVVLSASDDGQSVNVMNVVGRESVLQRSADEFWMIESPE